MKYFSLSLVALILLGLSSCGDGHEVEIDFQNPVKGDVLSVEEAANLEVAINFSSDHELHEIEVKLFPSDLPADLILDYDGHDHSESYNFTQSVDLSSYESGSSFTLEAVVCEDHDCEESYKESITFSIE